MYGNTNYTEYAHQQYSFFAMVKKIYYMLTSYFVHNTVDVLSDRKLYSCFEFYFVLMGISGITQSSIKHCGIFV